ncbi:MAG: hypothetical protein K2X39_08195 [Silvanigrellaceae bacterium]|nr:hypothetical protein [Silvanigrellaceae bacterium]
MQAYKNLNVLFIIVLSTFILNYYAFGQGEEDYPLPPSSYSSKEKVIPPKKEQTPLATSSAQSQSAPVLTTPPSAPVMKDLVDKASPLSSDMATTDLNHLSQKEQNELKQQEMALEEEDSNKLIDLSQSKQKVAHEKGQGLTWFFITLFVLLFVIFVFT